MSEPSAPAHAAVTVSGQPFRDGYFDYAAHDNWAQQGYCPVVSASKTWCGKRAGHREPHGSPRVVPAGQRETIRWADWDF